MKQSEFQLAIIGFAFTVILFLLASWITTIELAQY